MSVEINQVVTDNGKKIDTILKRSKDTRNYSTKSNEFLSNLKERTGKVSICYKLVVSISIIGFMLFLLYVLIN